MIRSLYDGAATLHVLQRQHEETAHNLANINTGGFRRAYLSVVENSGSHFETDHRGFGPQVERRNIDFSEGRLEETRRPLDLAITGDAFFVLENAQGQTVYSRSGRFFREVGNSNAADGTLINDAGLKIIGSNGPITIPPSIPESEISIGVDGSIVANGNQVGKLKLASFENNQTLVPINQSTFRASELTIEKEPTAEIRQKFFESSNVNATGELISLIVGGRLYEAVQKATTTISESLEQSIRA